MAPNGNFSGIRTEFKEQIVLRSLINDQYALNIKKKKFDECGGLHFLSYQKKKFFVSS